MSLLAWVVAGLTAWLALSIVVGFTLARAMRISQPPVARLSGLVFGVADADLARAA